MDTLLTKIYELQKTNAQTIGRVEAVEEVETFNYWIEYNNETGSFKLNESVKKRQAAKIIADHRPKVSFETEIWDVFNDRPDWTCLSWQDLKRLNAMILSIARKFELLDKSKTLVESDLAKYLHNLEEIRQSLAVVVELTTSQRPREEELQPDIQLLNLGLQNIIKKGVAMAQEPEPSDFFVGSSILKPEHVTQLCNWYGTGWKLLYKASIDGWTSSQFHAKCDNKGSTITVISHSNGKFLIGGYTTASWNCSGTYVADSEASLFTLVNPLSITGVFSVDAQRDGYAIYCDESLGPTFGEGYDLCVASSARTAGGSYSAFPHSYRDSFGRGRELFARSDNWLVAEVEVYNLS